MSRIGKKPVEITAKTKVEVKGQAIHVEGPKGKLEWIVPSPIKIEVKDGKVIVTTAQLDRVNAIALAPVEDFRRDSDLFGDGMLKPEAQSQNQAALKRGFQTRDAEMNLAHMLGEL